MSREEKLVVGGIAALLVVVFLVPLCVVTGIPAGNVGVLSTFGKVSDDTLPPGGPYLIAPWRSVTRVSVQTQKDEEPATVPTRNGLSVNLKAVLLFHVDPAKAPSILREVGDQYEAKIVDPFFRNAVRDVCAEFDPEALYTADRQKVEGGILAKVTKELGERGFVVESVMLQDPTLPQVVVERIQAKVAAEQDAIRMQSVFKQREQEAMAAKRQKELEAEAKVIEAKGIAEAQAIIKKDLSREYLVYAWIEALKESAKHNNATIYVPTGSDGMPFFKDVHVGGK